MRTNNKWLIITIVLLAICVLGLESYIIYDKFFTENDTQTEPKDTETNQLKEINLEDNRVINVMETFNYQTYNFNEGLLKLYSGNMNPNMFTKKELLFIALSQIKSIPVCTIEGVTTNITIDEINNILKERFKTIPSITIQDVKNTLEEFSNIENYIIAVQADDSITVYSNECDGAGVGPVDYLDKKIVKAQMDDNYLYVYEKIAFMTLSDKVPTEEDNTEFFYDYYKNIDKKSGIIETIAGNKSDDVNWDLFDTYKWTFKIENDNYYLENVTLEK